MVKELKYKSIITEELNKKGVLGLIGNTPMVPIRRLNPNPNVLVLAKYEALNPGGSIKARIALSMIEAAERSGELHSGKTILEATSGNTGIGLAIVAAVKGYPIILAMSEAVSLERRKILSALGADFLLTDPNRGTDAAIEAAYKLAREESDKYFLPDQFNNPANIDAHYHGTGSEIWRDTKGLVTHFVASMGTTGTLMGCSKRLKKMNPEVRIIGVEPYLGHKLQGLKNLKEAYVPGIYEHNALDEKINVVDEAAFEMTRRLATEEGLFVGMSSGAAMYVALEKAKSLKEGVMVVILPDGGERYLSTELFVVPEAEQTEPVESELRLINTFSRKKERFSTQEENKTVLYTCGPTLDQRPHLGLYRRIVLADVLRRYLEYRYQHEVKHIVGLVDMDQNVLAAAKHKGITPEEIVEQVSAEYMEDLNNLNILPATDAPRASQNTKDMLGLTGRLTEAGLAYEKLRSVYFRLDRYPEYGRVSGIDLDKIRIGSTVDLDRYEKVDPKDFTLLRRSTLAELRTGFYTESEWGNMSPSWHLQCAGLAMAGCGEKFDIHISGTDLIFPHHENTVALVRSLTGEYPSKFALHAEMILVDEKKMSRSGETAVTIPELLEMGFTGRVIRYFLSTTHYRQPLRFSVSSLEASRTSLNRIDDFVINVSNASGKEHEDEVDTWITELTTEFKKAMDDDLNVSAAMASIFTFARRVNTMLAKGRISKSQICTILETVRALTSLLGFMPDAGCPAGPEIMELIERRNKARENGDYDMADTIRENLSRRGIMVEDTPGGTRWRRKRASDDS